MSITINGNGTITGYTPVVADGSITSAKLAANSVNHTHTTGLQRRISTGPTAMTGGNMEHTVTSGVKKIEILLANTSGNGNTNMRITLGDTNGHTNSGYGYAAGFHRTGVSSREGSVTNFTSGWETYGLDANSYQIWGTWKLWNPHGNTWIGEHIFWGSQAANHTFYGNGYKTLTDTLTSVRVHTNSTTFDSGYMTVIETFGDD